MFARTGRKCGKIARRERTETHDAENPGLKMSVGKSPARVIDSFLRLVEAIFAKNNSFVGVKSEPCSIGAQFRTLSFQSIQASLLNSAASR